MGSDTSNSDPIAPPLKKTRTKKAVKKAVKET